MHLIENFTELCSHENLMSLNKLFDSEKLIIENFEKHLNLKDMEKHEVEKLDFFIEKCLKVYPRFYRSLLAKATNNIGRSHEALIKKLDEKAINLISHNSFFEVIELLSNQSFIYHKDLKSKKELEKISNKIVNLSKTEVIVKNIIIEIQEELIESFDDILIDSEKKYLSSLIGYEIYLRCKLPEEFVTTENTNEIYHLLAEIKMRNNNKARRILLEEVSKNTSPEKIIKILKANIIPF